ncbi:MAG: hypothetical protein H7Y17_06010 [Chlorobia bacterium]|nr:hypothetical protein [Fimbriimonadaceae bacterium]
MRDLSEVSGPWVGFWIQGLVRGNMGLRLSCKSGKIVGSGTDRVGSFKISGRYLISGKVEFTKRYTWHSVHYKGQWDDQMIYGDWVIDFEDSGLFEIWPESENQALGEVSIESEQTLELVKT